MTIFIAAGGTGGHIYPALAIADEFKKQDASVNVIFVGTPSGLENKIVPQNGFKILHVTIGRLNRVPLWEKILTLLRLPFAFLECRSFIKQNKPSLVLGVGGYASGPMVLVAALMGIPTAIWEPNAMPGLTNRWLSRFVDECFLVFDSARGYLKGRVFLPSGMPVRKVIEQAPNSLHHGFRNILVFGGSQGARTINTVVSQMLIAAPQLLERWSVVHQTGPADYERIRQAYGSLLQKKNLEVESYLHDMDQRYAWANVAICRAGAATLAELAATGTAAILIPLPTAADDHQRKNAEALSQKDAAIVLLQSEFTTENLKKKLEHLETHPDQLHAMEVNVKQFHHPHAAQELVAHLLERIRKPKS